MPYAPRYVTAAFATAALAASFCLNLLACTNGEPEVEIRPKPGTWSYEEEAVVSNSCPDVIVFPARSPTFLLDYDGGDEFQIEQVTAQDVMCTVDGVEFYCADYDLASVDVPGFAATINYVVRWDGEFTSDSIADGHEIIEVTCVGDDCTLIDMLPCARDVTFTAEFLN